MQHFTLDEWADFSRDIAEGGRRAAMKSSIKGEVKKKHFPVGRNFSCFAARLIERDLF